MLNLLLGSPRKRTGGGDQGWHVMGGVGGRRTLAGPVINEDRALNFSAVWCATRILAETIGGLPLPIYQRMADGGRQQVGSHYLSDILKLSPNPYMGAMPFREGRVSHQVNWGNAFAELERNPRGEVVAMWPIHPTRVRPVRPSDKQPDYAYWVRNNDGSSVMLRQDEVLHLPGVLSDDGIWGKGVVQYARESIGFGMATEQHGAAYFGNGAQPKGILTAAGLTKDPELRRNMRAEWKEVHGSPDSNEIVILPLDSTYVPISISNEDSQFLETRKHNITEIARWYRVPPHMLADLDRATFSNIEHQGLDFVIYSIMPWVRKWEDELNRKLLNLAERQEFFIEFNLAGLLRGDIKSRMEAYKLALESGIMTINEVRRLENMNNVGPDGDQHFFPLNMTTIARLATGPQQQPTPAAKTNTASLAATRAVVGDALSRMFTKEANAVQRMAKNAELDLTAALGEFHAKHSETCSEAFTAVAALLTSCDIPTQANDLAAKVVIDSAVIILAAYDSCTHEQFAKLMSGWAAARTEQTLKTIFAEDQANAE